MLALVAIGLARWPRVARWVAYGGSAVGGLAAINLAIVTLRDGERAPERLLASTQYFTIGLRADPLTAAFLLALGAAVVPVSIAAIGYGRHYDTRAGARLAAGYCIFVAAMLGVLLADGPFTFLLAWELMSLAGYLVVIHDHGLARVRRAGYVYLVMSHLATGFLLVAFLALAAPAGGLAEPFEALKLVAPALPAWLRDVAFLALLIGFCTKAGAVPLHVWLPMAHPVAPAHVSALMSGVMLKVALYGLARLAIDVMGLGPPWWGWLVLGVGATSALVGVLYAAVERDLKRLLAYSSIENVGIVLIGFGAFMVLTAAGRPGAPIALTAALFHVLNHALFKSLLFVGAGAVEKAAHSLDLDRLGGLARSMPWTAGFFLIGSAAIAALPPLNGFASEWMLFQALLEVGGLGGWVIAAALALTGGLAAATFARAYGIAFLGLARSPQASAARETDGSTRVGIGLLAGACVAIGVLPGLVTGSLIVITPGSPRPLETGTPGAYWPTSAIGLALVIVGLAWLLVRLLGRVPTRVGPAWVCGFALDSRMQYTATAFAQPTRLFFRWLFQPRWRIVRRWSVQPYFIAALAARGRTAAPFERRLYAPVAATGLRLASGLRGVQSGSLRLYLLYVFATLIVLLLVVR